MNFSAVQHLTHGYIGPFALNILRVGVSSLLLWAWWLVSPDPVRLQRKHLGRFLLCALTGVVINQSLFIQGLSMTLSIHAALLILVTPVFISLVAFWLGKEPLGLMKTAGLTAGIAGATLLALQKERQGGGSNILWGDILIIINAISYAFYFVLVRPLMQVCRPVTVIRWVFSFGLILILPIGAAQFVQIRWTSFCWPEFALLAFVVLGATFFAYLFNLYGIHRLGAGITGTYIYTQPVFATLIAVFLLGESLTLYKLLAAVLIFAGVYLVSRKSGNPAAASGQAPDSSH